MKNYDAKLKIGSLLIALSLCVLLIGCGSSEEAVEEERATEGTTVSKAPEAPVQKSKPMDDALTSFIGSEQTTDAGKATTQPSQVTLYEKQLEELRTENTTLKQRIVKLEQENRNINVRMSEVEAKYAAEKLRADKAEEMLKSNVVAAPTVPATPERITKPRKTGSVSAESVYEDGINAFNARKYDDALFNFKDVIETSDNDELVTRAKYWLGETYFAKKKYKEALPLFQEVLKSKHTAKKADAQFMLGQTYERLGNKEQAKAAYEKVVKNYPMSKNVKRAKERWAKL